MSTVSTGAAVVADAVIPAPVELDRAEGVLDLRTVTVDAPDGVLARLAGELLATAGAAVVPASPGPDAGARHTEHASGGGRAVAVVLTLDPAAGPAGSQSLERYTLTVAPDRATVAAPERAGLLHGVRTLRQLVNAGRRGAVPLDLGEPGGDDEQAGRGETSGPLEVGAVVVRDEPRYPWRGLSLDVVRHWFGPADLRAVVDLVGSYKMNRLHLHLSDDQGWRLEIPSRPALTEKSSQGAVSGATGGFLTADEYRELQEYAAEREIVIVPEIDVPGHVNAATHAYGELMPSGEATDTYDGIEVGFSKLHIDLPGTEPFLRDVFTDVARMTLGPWVHFGADEVLTMRPDEFGRFITLCQEIVTGAGKTPVAWQEAAGSAHGDQSAVAALAGEAAASDGVADGSPHGGAAGAVDGEAPVRVRPGTVLQYWDTRPDPAPFLRAAQAGAKFVMSPATRAYLDMKYTPDHPLGQQWAAFVELHDSYDWDPATLIEGLPESAIEGVSAAVWTETLASRDDLFSMLLPRLAAVAETAWSRPGDKDWESFRARVAIEAATWRRDGARYHPTPQISW
ncbi:hexosaminidase [Promicromonospora umidemergens]|uniref:beta-N-acetylhexosaminidase n=1 Tax=Promicromonospora umidemergens TaxID=629679 RepID=A0ABP8WD05_9MICO|nr:family 20 glycosylhydrolase [Promicromonospora umidemergens]MCP2285907.1 hexosaminidase [Promicromonospora umidemergens]